MPLPKYSKDRVEVVDYLRSQLIGPAGGEGEELSIGDKPTDRYLMGKLFPQDVKTDEVLEEQEIDGADSAGSEEMEEGWTDSPISLAFQRLPASIGISFFHSGGESFIVNVHGTVYEKKRANQIRIKAQSDSLENIRKSIDDFIESLNKISDLEKVDYELNESTNEAFFKCTLKDEAAEENALDAVNECMDTFEDSIVVFETPNCTPIHIWKHRNLADEGGEEVKVSVEKTDSTVLEGKAELRSYWRPMENGHLITVSLSNNAQSKKNTAKPEDCLFQTGIKITPEGGAIEAYPRRYGKSLGKEEEELELIYRKNVSYAVGHGCSSDWKINGEGRVDSVHTEFMPQKEVPGASTKIEGIDTSILSIQSLAKDELDRNELAKALRKFTRHYEQWIKGLKTADDIPGRLEDAANRITRRLDAAVERMHRGIDLLESNDLAQEVFTLANRAMLMQMIHGRHEFAGSSYEKGQANPDHPDYFADNYSEIKWHPFQLAFQLLVIESVLNETSPERDLVDLIWFPTGGGKTEAYLAVAAMEIFHRRIKHGKAGGGTAVLKRYTLRLLTHQQFERAARLICACEIIRQGDDRLGQEPITTGLWVGESASPNHYTSRHNQPGALQKHENQLEKQWPNNPFSLINCPWCGTTIYPSKKQHEVEKYYGVRATENSFEFFCPDERCVFHELIPVNVVDSHIYENPPTLVIGTIDKLARITWDPTSRKIFGWRNGENNVRPPSLVIQDEMHLISGPLGTMAGIYEAAFDVMMSKLCKPKIIAATATIRRAESQVKQLYARELRLFPPSGLDASDSFYSKHDNLEDNPGRLYVGCMGQGTTPVFSLVQLCAALSQAPFETTLKPEAKDAYWTQVIFHNSKRELGKTMTLARDDIPSRIEVIARDQSRVRSPEADDVVELSANLQDYEIPKVLQRMGMSVGSQGAIDMLPCTNMLSVGVDIPRLGLMVVNGQPKTTSEYIQASSRVGRDKVPGLVIAHYSSTKPRDRSHYETFVSYHDALYRAVEPTSVTPYSLPAMDRALHAALISLMRVCGGLHENEDARKFDPTDPEHKELIESFKERISAAVPEHDRNQALQKIQQVIDQWVEATESTGRPLRFETKKNMQYTPLICMFSEKNVKTKAWPTLNSMRNVDEECHIKINGQD